MRKTVQLLLAASLCGCVAAAPQPDAGGQRVDPIPISLALEEIITTGIRQRLHDPAFAKFGTMLAGERALNGHQEIVVCGTVNARSTSGAYGGDEPFIAKIFPDAGSSFELVAMGDGSPNGRLVVGAACRTAGLPILDLGPKT
ncbi:MULTISPECIES: hypothetical protein [unclassified Mesorhizobium]|uniref:hypothetical protein n=1 Tax=unclassified Mesorhizobium TaxID=325217 RepID=UPI000F75DE0D|nr:MULTISPECIES: hypothetical protein [unclassified Mesorhizobium]AZO30283.1 hypothetical protein EJ071_24765 [Mesorhizobium sp. M1B.F.Ca.ET.045.04.1.1]RWA80042.1 MAG: hypothetical protein EOQ30_24510 [Mesorhizobium sp.]RWB18831.1 MAG: hypothetical protein EOQ40_22985 [Mesorhizobium sp.]TIS47737.1 MAG: hypothetical protein E5W96_21705 [Mesorhizobium sp.]TIS48210.1 MAG: hypothetical protein E5W96_17820 [Mesorhizobium sp.]